MVTQKLKTLVQFSIPIFILHGLEEYMSKFYNIDPLSRFVFQSFQNMSVLQATFLLFQIMIAVLLIVSYLLLQGERWILKLTTVFGLFFIFELHHLVKAIIVGGYYPGLITAIVIYILGISYWKELIKNWRKYYDRS